MFTTKDLGTVVKASVCGTELAAVVVRGILFVGSGAIGVCTPARMVEQALNVSFEQPSHLFRDPSPSPQNKSADETLTSGWPSTLLTLSPMILYGLLSIAIISLTKQRQGTARLP